MDFTPPDTALAVRDGVRAVGARYDHACWSRCEDEHRFPSRPGGDLADGGQPEDTRLLQPVDDLLSKSELLAEVLRWANDELDSRIRRAVDEAGDEAAPRLREAVRAYVRFAVKHQLAMLVSVGEVPGTGWPSSRPPPADGVTGRRRSPVRR